MGQYYWIANLSKMEMINPHNFKSSSERFGYNFQEFKTAGSDMAGVYAFLTRLSSEMGAGGDIRKEYKWAGHWAFDKIATVGDYCSWKDFTEATGLLWTKEQADFKSPFDFISAKFKDISAQVFKEYKDCCIPDAEENPSEDIRGEIWTDLNNLEKISYNLKMQRENVDELNKGAEELEMWLDSLKEDTEVLDAYYKTYGKDNYHARSEGEAEYVQDKASDWWESMTPEERMKRYGDEILCKKGWDELTDEEQNAIIDDYFGL